MPFSKQHSLCRFAIVTIGHERRRKHQPTNLFSAFCLFIQLRDAFVFTGPHLMLCPPPLCLFYLLSQMVRLTDFHFRCHIFKATHGAIFLTNTWPRSLWRHYLYHSHSHVSALSAFNLKFSKALLVKQKSDEPHVCSTLTNTVSEIPQYSLTEALKYFGRHQTSS